MKKRGRLAPPPLFSSFLAEVLLDRGRDAADLVRLQQLVLRRDGGLDRGRDLRAPVSVADAVDVGAELLVGADLELAGLRGLDRVVDRDIDLLEGAGHHPGAEVALVGVDADAEDVLAVRRVERAETARAGDLELDDRAGGDLIQRRFLALRLSGEALRVVVECLDARIGLLRAVLVARDVPVDRRDLDAADRADRLGALLLRIEARGVPDEVAGLLLAEEQTFDVLR